MFHPHLHSIIEYKAFSMKFTVKYLKIKHFSQIIYYEYCQLIRTTKEEQRVKK